jgi:hypothetical protein
MVDVAAFLSLCLWAVMVDIAIKRGDIIPIAVFGLLPLLGLYSSLMTRIRYATIAVDESGISARAFGRQQKVIPWKGVVRILRRRAVDLATHAYKNVFYLDATESTQDFFTRGYLSNWRLRRSSISFDETIGSLRELLDSINVYVRRYGIEVISIDLEADQNRAALTERSWRKRLWPDATENRITEL